MNYSNYVNYQSLLSTIDINNKYKFLYYGYKNELPYTYITFFNDKRYLYFNRTNIAGVLIDSKKIIKEYRGVFKVCCRTSFYCLIIQEIGTISKLYDLDGVLICTFNTLTSPIIVNDKLNDDLTYTIFIKDCLLNELLLINLYDNIKVKDIKQNNLNIPFNILLNFNIDKNLNGIKELMDVNETVDLFNYITTNREIETLKYNINMIVNNGLINIKIKNKLFSSLNYNGLMYYIVSNNQSLLLFINFVNNKSYVYNMKFELIDILDELIFGASTNKDNFDLFLNGVINNYKSNLLKFKLIDIDLNLDDLNNIKINNLIDNNLLKYDIITNKWINTHSIDCGLF